MRASEFKKVVASTLTSVKDLLIKKGDEYSSKEDVFHNFRKGVGRIGGDTPEKVLLSYKLKHDVSVEDMVFDNNPQAVYTEEYIDEKINDSIAYLVLLKGMLKNRNNKLPF